MDPSGVPQPAQAPHADSAKKVSFSPNVSVVRDAIVAQEEVEEPLPDQEGLEEELVFEEFGDRLYRVGMDSIEERERRYNEKREFLEAQKMVGATFHPKISKAARELGRYRDFNDFIRANEEAIKRAKSAYEKKAAQHIDEELEECLEKPDMCPKTQKMVEKMLHEDRYKSPVSNWHEFVAAHSGTATGTGSTPRAEKSQSHKPFISPTAKKLSRGGKEDVFDKLYTDSLMRSAARDIITSAQEVQESTLLFHPVINAGPGHPGTTVQSMASAGSVSRRAPEDVGESLYRKGEEYAAHLEMLRKQRLEEEMKGVTFKPHTNKFSRRLLHKFSSIPPEGDPSHSRSMPGTASDMKSTAIRKRMTRPRARFDVDAFCSKINRFAVSRAERLHELKHELAARELAPCTFRPKMSRGTNEIFRRLSGEESGSKYSYPRSWERATLRSYQAEPGDDEFAPAEREDEGIQIDPESESRQMMTEEPSPPALHSYVDDEDGGMQYLANLENELRGVIAEWKNVSSL